MTALNHACLSHGQSDLLVSNREKRLNIPRREIQLDFRRQLAHCQVLCPCCSSVVCGPSNIASELDRLAGLSQTPYLNTLPRQFIGRFILRKALPQVTLGPSQSGWAVAGTRYLKRCKPQQAVRETEIVQQEPDFLWKFQVAPKSCRVNHSTEFRDNVLFPGCVVGERPWGDLPLVLKSPWVEGNFPWAAPEAKEGQPPLPQQCGQRGPCPLSLVPEGPCSPRVVRMTLNSFWIEPQDEQGRGCLSTSIKSSGGTESPDPGALRALPTLRGQLLQASDPHPPPERRVTQTPDPAQQNKGTCFITAFLRSVSRHKTQARAQSFPSVFPGAGPPTESDKWTKFVDR